MYCMLKSSKITHSHNVPIHTFRYGTDEFPHYLFIIFIITCVDVVDKSKMCRYFVPSP